MGLCSNESILVFFLRGGFKKFMGKCKKMGKVCLGFLGFLKVCKLFFFVNYSCRRFIVV